MSEEIVTLQASRDNAKKLWFFFQMYINGLQKHELELAQARLSNEFDKFENWLRSKSIELNKD